MKSSARIGLGLALLLITSELPGQEKLWVHTLSGTPSGLPPGPVSIEPVDGARDEAILVRPRNVAVDPFGRAWVVEGQTIRRVDPDGSVTTIAGVAGERGDADGFGAAARFNAPVGITWSPDGNLYVVDAIDDTVRRVSPEGMVTTIAGEPDGEFLSGAYRDGTLEEARFHTPHGIVADRDGNLFIADTINHAVRMIDTEGRVTTVVGDPSDGFTLNTPVDIDIDTNGNLYLIDENLWQIFRLTQGGELTSLGTPTNMRAWGIAVSPDGTIYFTDTERHAVRRFEPGGQSVTVAGMRDTPGYADGRDSLLDSPFGIDVDDNGRVFIADTQNDSIRIAADGPPPTIESFSVSATRVARGTEIFFEWSVSGADSVTIEGIGEVAPDGIAIVIPTFTREYRLVAINDTGPVTEAITVVVDQPRRRGVRRGD